MGGAEACCGGAMDLLRATGAGRGLLYRGDACGAGWADRAGAVRAGEADRPPARLVDWASASTEIPNKANANVTTSFPAI